MRRTSLLAAVVACALLAPIFAVAGLAAPGANKPRSERAERDASGPHGDRGLRKGKSAEEHDGEIESGAGDDDGSRADDGDEPKPSPSPKPDDERDDRKPVASASPAAAVLESTVIAEPSSISIGEESRVTVTVSNTGDAEAVGVEALLSIPSQVDLVDASEPHTATPAGNKVTFELGSIAPGDSASAWADVEGVEATDASGVEIFAVATVDEQDVLSDPGSTTIAVLGDVVGELDLNAMTREVLVQVGRRIHYVITVTNDSDLPLAKVAVIDRVPAEVAVFRTPPGEADAMQTGVDFRGREDIVWIEMVMDPGETLRVSWVGLAKTPGDLAALNRVTAKAVAAVPARESHVTYLGAARFTGTTNPPFEPIVKARRITREVTLPSTQAESEAPGASLLPFTGSGNFRWVLAGLALLAAGVFLLWARRSVRRRRWITLALVCLLLASSACVGSDEPAEEAQESRKEEVKGQRIERNQNEKKQNRRGRSRDEGDDAAPGPVAQPAAGVGVTGPGEVTGVPPTGDTTTGDATTGDDGAAAPAPPPETTTVSEVRTTRIGVEDLPVVVLGPTAADNSLTYTWEEPNRDIVQASSSVTFTRGQPVDFTTSVGTDGNAIHVGVVLRNVARARRLAVSGRLMQEVSDSSGTVATFESPVDTVLAPGGEARASFTYLLPTGDYSVTARFEPS